MKRCLLFAALALRTPAMIFAQTATGAIQGTISDQDGGIIIGARG